MRNTKKGTLKGEKGDPIKKPLYVLIMDVRIVKIFSE